jgi:hypothetical protein
MKKLVWLVLALLVVLCDCKNSTTPDPIDPVDPVVPATFWTLKVEYTRTEILQEWAVIETAGGRITGLTEKSLDFQIVDRYNQVAEINDTKFQDNENSGIEYHIWVSDRARMDGIDAGTSIVGRVIKLTVKETGSVFTIITVVRNNDPKNPCKTEKAEMGKFVLKHDGTITDV